MSTMNLSLPEMLKKFIDEQVSKQGYRTGSEYVRDLIRREQDRLHLRGLLLDGLASPPAGIVDEAYFERLRDKIRKPAKR
jgi:antitoxin ParD1/3/4